MPKEPERIQELNFNTGKTPKPCTQKVQEANGFYIGQVRGQDRSELHVDFIEWQQPWKSPKCYRTNALNAVGGIKFLY